MPRDPCPHWKYPSNKDQEEIDKGGSGFGQGATAGTTDQKSLWNRKTEKWLGRLMVVKKSNRPNLNLQINNPEIRIQAFLPPSAHVFLQSEPLWISKSQQISQRAVAWCCNAGLSIFKLNVATCKRKLFTSPECISGSWIIKTLIIYSMHFCRCMFCEAIDLFWWGITWTQSQVKEVQKQVIACSLINF